MLNYLSVDQRLPSVFKPVSPPPYLNGGVEFLSWVTESHDASFTAQDCAHGGFRVGSLTPSPTLTPGRRMAREPRLLVSATMKGGTSL